MRGGAPSGQEEIQMAAKAEQAGKPETWMLGASWGKQGGGKGGMGGIQSDARWEKSHEGLIVTPREDSFGPEV